MHASRAFAPTESGSRGTPPARDRNIPEGSSLLDWTNLDIAPETPDLGSLAVGAAGGRIAVLVNSPKILRAATMFAEQAGLHGTVVRVFVDENEATCWLSKGQNRPQS